MGISVDDQLAIRHLIDNYFLSLDLGEGALTEACFTPDADIVHRGGSQRFRGPAQLVAALPDMLGAYRATTHSLANLNLRADGQTVHARYSAVVTLAHRTSSAISVRGVRYDDSLVSELEQRDAAGAPRWQIARRRHDRIWQYTVQGDDSVGWE